MKDTNQKEFENKNIVLILNGICFIMTLFFTHKHYFSNADKGIDDVFYALAIFSLYSFFALSALKKINTNKLSAKNWLIAGILYVILGTLFIEFELFKGIYFISLIPLVFFIPSLFFLNNLKRLNVVLDGAIATSYITCILPAYSFLLLILSIFTKR